MDGRQLSIDVRLCSKHTYDIYLVNENYRRVLIGKSLPYQDALRMERELKELMNGK